MNELTRTQWQIRCAFNDFCKQVLKNEAINAHKRTKWQQLREVTFSDLARPFFLKQFTLQETHQEQAAKGEKTYYDNDLVVVRPDGAPIPASWVFSQFGKMLEGLDMPQIHFHDLRHTAATNMHQLTGDFYTVGEVLGHTLAGIGASLGLSMNFEAVAARYVDVRLYGIL